MNNLKTALVTEAIRQFVLRANYLIVKYPSEENERLFTNRYLTVTWHTAKATRSSSAFTPVICTIEAILAEMESLVKDKYPDYVPYSETRGSIPICSTVCAAMCASPATTLHFTPTTQHRTNTFTHDGDDYDLDKLDEILQDAPVSKVNIVDLIWIFDHCSPDPRRMALVDLKVPIYVTQSEDGLVAVDGLHRLSLAYVTGRKTLPAKMVTQEMLDQVKIS